MNRNLKLVKQFVLSSALMDIIMAGFCNSLPVNHVNACPVIFTGIELVVINIDFTLLLPILMHTHSRTYSMRAEACY